MDSSLELFFCRIIMMFCDHLHIPFFARIRIHHCRIYIYSTSQLRIIIRIYSTLR